MHPFEREHLSCDAGGGTFNQDSGVVYDFYNDGDFTEIGTIVDEDYAAYFDKSFKLDG